MQQGMKQVIVFGILIFILLTLTVYMQFFNSSEEPSPTPIENIE